MDAPCWVEDGFGSAAEKCELPDCGLHVCRPGPRIRGGRVR